MQKSEYKPKGSVSSMRQLAALLVCLGFIYSLRSAPSVSMPSMEAATVSTKVGGNYADKNRNFNMVLGADITPGGRIWAAWIGGGDSHDGYLLAASSDDKGRTWTKPILVIDPHRYEIERQGMPKRRILVGNFWTDPTGKLWLFYDQSLGYFDGRAGVWATTAINPDKRNVNWSQPKRLFHGALLNKPIVTSKGEWLAFASLWRRSMINPAIFQEGHHDLDAERGINVYRSVDQGASWQRISVLSIAPERWEFDEPSVVELKSGELWMLIRISQGLAESFSEDGGLTWSRPIRSNISSAPARVFLRRLKSGSLILVKYGRLIDANIGRAELTAYLSTDDGRSWKGGLVIDERPAVSYPDGFQDREGIIHIIYDYDRSGEAEILMSSFTEGEILAGEYLHDNELRRVIVSKALKPKPPQPKPPQPKPPQEKPITLVK